MGDIGKAQIKLIGRAEKYLNSFNKDFLNPKKILIFI